ncbi:HK97 gp10 family phage protein [Pelagibacterium sp. 26DY04]|uniref:HK97 gp10 family phage protein n=1 Tax=Pelagibacterium sp. 26DY04 TaxID=2967130 RepID=UPI0028161C52|nr:HK97 gp10 family phage protein [Pelagibacterium sp. 26DY04]WMT85568.1 HK97 gp10 family phage protein [Pelagibacterium sp. 26DY04]
MTSFEAQVGTWAAKVPGAIDAVRKGAAQDVVGEMQTPRGAGGHMRVRTGFLWNSLMASTSRMPSINPEYRPPSDASPGSYSYSAADIELVILGSDITDPLYFGYTAAYAGIREYRDGFIRLAAQNWQQHVAENVRRVRSALKV